MSKIAIITDSNSGITQAEAKELGITVLPMPFIINETLYFEDINLTQEEFYNHLSSGVSVSTSQPTPDDVMSSWENSLKDNDEVVYIPMSSGLSGSCSTATALSSDYNGKVQVVNNQRISVTQRQSVLDAIELANGGKNACEIKQILEEKKMDASIYITLDTLEYLKRGGRLTPAVAAMGSALRIKPVLKIQGERLDTHTVALNQKQGISKMVNSMKKDIENRFGGMENIDNIHLSVAHTNNYNVANDFKMMIEETFGAKNVVVNPLSLSVSCHIGPGALAIACSKAI